jgi:hypothetical protein
MLHMKNQKELRELKNKSANEVNGKNTQKVPYLPVVTTQVFTEVI